MAKIISIFNQKGGVGKTTTAINFAAALAGKKKKTLIIDFDPQGNGTSGLGIDRKKLKSTIYDVMVNDQDINETIKKTQLKNLKIAPANSDLAAVEVELHDEENKEFFLKNSLKNLEDFDYIIIDCPPSLGILSINALVASDSVLIPIQTEYYALEGAGLMMETITRIRSNLNKELEIEGIVLTMFDNRNNLSLDVVKEVKNHFKDKVYKSIIPRNIRLAEAPSYGESIFEYDKKSKGAKAYGKLAAEFLKRNEE